MREILNLLAFALAAVFGVALSAAFSGADQKKGARWKLALFSALALFVQGICWVAFGLDVTKQLYPLIAHVPLAVFLAACLHAPWINSIVSVLAAYLCCQIPRWLADVAYLVSRDDLFRNILYILIVPVVYYLLRRFVSKPVRELLSQSRQRTLFFATMPLLYYLFDYIFTVYTDLLHRGEPLVVQLMPTVLAVSYFLFLLLCHSSLAVQEKIRRERDLLALQLRRAGSEVSAMQEMQEQAKRYRHDLRYHFALLMGYAESGELQKIKDYLRDAQEDLNAYTPKRFCGNPLMDLLLSHFESRAESVGVGLSVRGLLPEHLPFEDTELCSLLSNGLENAILAASCVSSGPKRRVEAALSVRQQNLLISIQNPYEGTVTMADGLPVTGRAGHGLGTRGMVSIVNSHAGQISFSADNGVFLLRIMLPMDRQDAAGV